MTFVNARYRALRLGGGPRPAHPGAGTAYVVRFVTAEADSGPHLRQMEKLKPPQTPVLPSETLVKFRVHKPTAFGQVVKTIGDSTTFGAWATNSALSLNWTEGDNWVGEVRLPPGKYEFKAIVLNEASGSVDWENGSNRQLEVPPFPGIVEVDYDWAAPAVQTRFLDIPPTAVDPIEVAAQQAAAQHTEDTAADVLGGPDDAPVFVSSDALEKLTAARQAILEDVQRLRTADDSWVLGGAPAAAVLAPDPAIDAFHVTHTPQNGTRVTEGPINDIESDVLTPPAASKKPVVSTAHNPVSAETPVTDENTAVDNEHNSVLAPSSPTNGVIVTAVERPPPLQEPPELTVNLMATPTVNATHTGTSRPVADVEGGAVETKSVEPSLSALTKPVSPDAATRTSSEVATAAAVAATSTAAVDSATVGTDAVTSESIVVPNPDSSDATEPVGVAEAANTSDTARVRDFSETPAGRALSDLWSFLASGRRRR